MGVDTAGAGCRGRVASTDEARAWAFAASCANDSWGTEWASSGSSCSVLLVVRWEGSYTGDAPRALDKADDSGRSHRELQLNSTPHQIHKEKTH